MAEEFALDIDVSFPSYGFAGVCVRCQLTSTAPVSRPNRSFFLGYAFVKWR